MKGWTSLTLATGVSLMTGCAAQENAPPLPPMPDIPHFADQKTRQMAEDWLNRLRFEIALDKRQKRLWESLQQEWYKRQTNQCVWEQKGMVDTPLDPSNRSFAFQAAADAVLDRSLMDLYESLSPEQRRIAESIIRERCGSAIQALEGKAGTSLLETINICIAGTADLCTVQKDKSTTASPTRGPSSPSYSYDPYYYEAPTYYDNYYFHFDETIYIDGSTNQTVHPPPVNPGSPGGEGSKPGGPEKRPPPGPGEGGDSGKPGEEGTRPGRPDRQHPPGTGERERPGRPDGEDTRPDRPARESADRPNTPRQDEQRQREQAQRQSDEQRRQAEENEARQRADEQRRQVEAEQQRQREQAQRQADQQRRQAEENEARQRADEQRRQADAEQQRQREQAQRQADQQRRQAQENEARQRADEQRRQADAEQQRQREQAQRQADEQRQRAEAEARQRADEQRERVEAETRQRAEEKRQQAKQNQRRGRGR